jgi:hypothetical protein
MLTTNRIPVIRQGAKSFLMLALAGSLSSQARSQAPGLPLFNDEMGRVTAGSFDLYTLQNAAANNNVGDYTITGGGASDGSISFIGIVAPGSFGETHQVMDEITFRQTLVSLGMTAPSSFYGGGPVAYSMALADPSNLPSVSIAAIRMGNSDASFGSIQVKRIDMRGTSSWSWTR